MKLLKEYKIRDQKKVIQTFLVNYFQCSLNVYFRFLLPYILSITFRYKSTQIAGVNRSAGLRWHQGVIDKVTTDSNGTKLYSGRHSKGANEGKWITYKVKTQISKILLSIVDFFNAYN